MRPSCTHPRPLWCPKGQLRPAGAWGAWTPGPRTPHLEAPSSRSRDRASNWGEGSRGAVGERMTERERGEWWWGTEAPSVRDGGLRSETAVRGPSISPPWYRLAVMLGALTLPCFRPPRCPRWTGRGCLPAGWDRWGGTPTGAAGGGPWRGQ